MDFVLLRLAILVAVAAMFLLLEAIRSLAYLQPKTPRNILREAKLILRIEIASRIRQFTIAVDGARRSTARWLALENVLGYLFQGLLTIVAIVAWLSWNWFVLLQSPLLVLWIMAVIAFFVRMGIKTYLRRGLL